jgi:3-oxoacyl-[acyl-carrier-protein] synthase II
MSIIDPTPFPCKVSGEVQDFDPTEGGVIHRREARRMGRFSQFAVHASDQAIKDAGLDLDQEDRERVGILIGCGAGGLPETDEQAMVKARRGALRVSPFYVPIMLVNMCSANVSRVFGLLGYTNTCVTACAASTQAIGEAAEVIRRSAADVILTGGTEAGICELGMGGFSTIHALTTRDCPPEEASRPFDADRDGFVPSEGAAMFVLESLQHAKARGADIYAEVTGWGASSDAFHLVQPDDEGKGAALAIKLALKDAERNIEDVHYINAHGTSTPLNDKSETLAIKRAFGDHAYNVPISSTKSMIGHSLGASGAMEAMACIGSIRDQVLHPTINLDTPDPDCDLDYIPNEARETKVDVTLSNSFGFGGQNACLVMEKFNG